LEYGRAVNPAQAVVNSVETTSVIIAAVVDKLSVSQSVEFVVEHHVRPVEVEHRHIPQVDDAVGIAVDIVTAVVQMIERCFIERSEHETQDAVDNGGSSIGVPSNGDHRAPPNERSGTMSACGRGQGATPTVVRIVPTELIAVVVVVVVEAVVGIVTAVPVVAIMVASIAITVVAMTVAVAILVLTAAVAVKAIAVAIRPVVAVAILVHIAVIAIATIAVN
jgi:hypothetical protein